MSNKVKLLSLGVSILIVAFLSLWQVFTSFKALSSKTNQAEGYNIEEFKETLSIWGQRKPFILEVTPQTLVEVTKIPVEKKEFKAEILNGSESAGTAAELKDKIESQVEGVKVTALGNTEATISSFLQFKATVSEEIKEAVVKLLEKELVNVDQATLSAEAEVDILIIIGR